MAIFKHIFKPSRFHDRAGCTSRQDVRRLLEYQMRPSESPEVVWNNFHDDSPLGITEEVMALARPDLTYKAYHFVMSFPEDERDQWEANLDSVLEDFARRFGVHRMIWVRHRSHVHGFVFAQTALRKKMRLETRVGGKLLPVAASLRKMAEDWEDRLGVRRTGRSPALGTSVSKDALELAYREHAEGKSPTPVPAKLQLRADVQRLVARSRSFAELESNARDAGIEIRYTKHANGTGVSFSDGNVSLRGREAGFTFQTLTQLYHEPNPTIVRSRPDPSLAERNRPGSRGATPPRNAAADRHPRKDAGDAVVGQRSERSPHRGVETTLRNLSRVNHQTGLLQLLQFLAFALERMATAADYPRTAPRKLRPTL